MPNRYQGLNPDYVRSVLQKRRMAKAAKLVPTPAADIAEQYKTIEVRRVKTVSVKSIIAEVAAKYALDPEDIIDDQRNKVILIARWEAIYTAHKRRPELSHSRLAQLFKRDRTTVTHAIKRFEELTA